MPDSKFPRAYARHLSLPLLGDVLDGLCGWLHLQGYPPDAISRRVAAAPLLEEFLGRQQVDSLQDCPQELLTSCVPQPRRWAAHMAYALARSLEQYLAERGDYLVAKLPTPTEKLAHAYQTFLVNVRGLALATVTKHIHTATGFLRFLDHDSQPQQLHELQVSEIEAYLVEAGRRLDRVTMQHVTATLRSFLRFLAAEGKAPVGLDAYVESPRLYRGERLPRAIPWDDVLRLLGSIDRSSSKGRRDYGMLLLIATYGLRRGEVAGLKLDDILWREREINVPRPKIGRPLLLPLTDEVATALLDYLRHARPKSSSRRLFLRVRVPLGPIGPSAISDAFDAWATRANIDLPHPGGPHCLRHSLAMHLSRQGAPLKTIGDLLGHRSAESTSVYLRLNVEDLRDVALPLPSAGGEEVRS